jgi:hypothetical protein
MVPVHSSCLDPAYTLLRPFGRKSTCIGTIAVKFEDFVQALSMLQ